MLYNTTLDMIAALKVVMSVVSYDSSSIGCNVRPLAIIAAW